MERIWYFILFYFFFQTYLETAIDNLLIFHSAVLQMLSHSRPPVSLYGVIKHLTTLICAMSEVCVFWIYKTHPEVFQLFFQTWEILLSQESRPVGSGAAWRRSPHQKSAGREREGRERRKEREKRRKKRREKGKKRERRVREKDVLGL